MRLLRRYAPRNDKEYDVKCMRLPRRLKSARNDKTKTFVIYFTKIKNQIAKC